MKPFMVSLRIWFLTIVLNTVLLGIASMFLAKSLGGLFAIFLLFIAGIVFAAPLLPLTSLLVKWSIKLPYSVPSCIVWLGFCLSGLIVLFFMTLSYVMDHHFIAEDEFFRYVILSTIAALIMTLYLTRTSIKQLHYDVKCRKTAGCNFSGRVLCNL